MCQALDTEPYLSCEAKSGLLAITLPLPRVANVDLGTEGGCEPLPHDLCASCFFPFHYRGSVCYHRLRVAQCARGVVANNACGHSWSLVDTCALPRYHVPWTLQRHAALKDASWTRCAVRLHMSERTPVGMPCSRSPDALAWRRRRVRDQIPFRLRVMRGTQPCCCRRPPLAQLLRMHTRHGLCIAHQSFPGHTYALPNCR